MIGALRRYAVRLAAEETAARGEAFDLLSTRSVALARSLAASRHDAGIPKIGRRRAARVLQLVEQASEQPDTATRWADPSGRWDQPPAERLAKIPEPLWIDLLLRLTGTSRATT